MNAFISQVVKNPPSQIMLPDKLTTDKISLISYLFGKGKIFFYIFTGGTDGRGVGSSSPPLT